MAAKRIRLAQRRKSVGYTQERLAEYLGVERSTIQRWEKAETGPQPWVRPKLAAALGVTAEQLEELLADVTLFSAPASERMGYVLEHPTSVDLVAVARLHERIRQLDERYDVVPSTALLEPTAQLYGQVTYLREHATDPRVRRVLYEVEAESATFMSQVVWDVSQRRDHLAPQSYLDHAAEAAHQGRDPVGEAYAVLRKSYLALYGEQDPIKGLALARQASEVARSHSPALTGLALAHVAEGFAMTGDRQRCERSLDEAETQLGQIGEDEVAAPYFTMNEHHRLAGSCYLFLDLPARAEPILRNAISALATKQKSQAIALANLALALIRQQQLDEAASTLHRAIDGVELTRGGGGLNLVFAAGRELRPWQHESWVQDIHDRLLALIAAI